MLLRIREMSNMGLLKIMKTKTPTGSQSSSNSIAAYDKQGNTSSKPANKD